MGNARVFQISVSDGGVPKRAVREAEVTAAGVDGDRQNDTTNHGGPDRALCLFSLERILAMQEEGHAVFPGALGENVTISGLDWARARPGARLRIGADVIAEIASFTAPCRKIAASFARGDINRNSEKHHPGWSRVYARVLRPGRVRTGDTVMLEE